MEPVPLYVGEDGDEELWLLSVRRQRPAAGLAEQVQSVDKRDIRPVLLREPLDHPGAALLGAPNLLVVVATDHQVVYKSGHGSGLTNYISTTSKHYPQASSNSNIVFKPSVILKYLEH